MANVLLTRGWIVRHLLIVGAVVACLAAGFWQLSRLEERRARNTAIEAQTKLPPLTLRAAPAAEAALRRVMASGMYDADREIHLLNRPLDGRPGNHRLTPLVFEDGSAILVDRGWEPPGLPSQAYRESLPPDGAVEVSGMLFPSERLRPLTPQTAPTGHTASRIEIPGLAPRFPYRLAPVYLLLATQSPAQRGTYPVVIPQPKPAGGPPHLSYAIQWFSFAAIALGGHVLLARRAVRPPDPRKQRGRPAGGPSVQYNDAQGSR